MNNVTIFDHPLIQHKISILRSVETSSKEFRELIEEIAMLMAFEAFRDLPLEDTEITTPLTTTTTKVLAGKKILQTLGIRKNAVEVVACPTCARTEIDVEALAMRVEEMTASIDKPLTISILGCPLNGIGEGENSDLGIAGGKEKSVILKDGKIFKTVKSEDLLAEFEKLLQEKLK